MFLFYGSSDQRPLHSFPTRRSSDLDARLRRRRASKLVYCRSANEPRALGSQTDPASVDKQLESRSHGQETDRKSTRLNSSHITISYAVFCLKKKKHNKKTSHPSPTD